MGARYLLIALSFIVACKQRNASQLKHDFGKTSRVPEGFEFQPCELTFESKNRFPKTQQYLQRLASYIMEQNPQTFKKGSELDPEKFCFNVKFSAKFNALATATHRSVEIHSAAILAIENDANLAALIAHELAHITMVHMGSQHPKFTPNSENLKSIAESRSILIQFSTVLVKSDQLRDQILDEMAELPDAEALQNELLEIYTDLFDEISDEFGNTRVATYADRRNEFLQKIPLELRASIGAKLDDSARMFLDLEPLVDRYTKTSKKLTADVMRDPKVGLEESFNWDEQEADEVGFEFYRRAGLRDDEFFNMLYTLAISGGTTERDIIACMKASFKTITMKKEDFEPERGASTHPAHCWRIFDHQRETVLHEREYVTFPNSKVMIDITGLAEARAEIQADVRVKNMVYPSSDGPSGIQAPTEDNPNESGPDENTGSY